MSKNLTGQALSDFNLTEARGGIIYARNKLMAEGMKEAAEGLNVILKSFTDLIPQGESTTIICPRCNKGARKAIEILNDGNTLFVHQHCANQKGDMIA